MGEHLRALIVEDSDDDAQLLLRELRRGGYEPVFERVQTAEAMRDALQKQPWDVVISDHDMPHFSAPRALEVLKESEIDLPFIIVSGVIGEATAVAAMKAGAHDYLAKDKLARLVPSIERELTEAAIRRQHRRQHALSDLFYQVDRQLLEGKSLDAILVAICEKLSDVLRDALVWIGMKKPDGSISVHAHSEAHAGILQQIRGRWDDSPESLKPSGRAIQTGELQYSYFTDPCLQILQEEAERHGFRRAVAIPLFVKGSTAGVLVVFSPHEGEPDPEDRRTLTGVGAHISMALERILDHQKLRLQSVALSAAANAIFITDSQGKIEWVNDAFTRLSGYGALEAVGHTPRLLKSGEQDLPYYDALWRTILSGKVWRKEVQERTKAGNLYTVDQTITPLRDSQGNITHFVAIHDDITSRKEAEARLDHLAHHDSLTDLPNRVLFQGYLPVAIDQAHRSGHLLGLLFIDLDHFKVINDSLGHNLGDLLLKAAANRLRRSVRSTDLVVRLGGDEFAIVQPDLNRASGSSELARKVLKMLSEPFNLDGHRVYISASIGITICPLDNDDPNQLVKNADLAMYRAKHEGRNTCQFYAPEMNAQIRHRQEIEKDLHLAIDNHEFVLHYQPMVELQTRRLVGLEALVRWNHPKRGILGPGEFIGVAEESGLIAPLGQWVLQEAVVQCKAWQDASLPAVRVAVNASMFQFRHQDMVQAVTELLEQTGLEARYLGLELTESMLMCNLEILSGDMGRLHRMGIELSIDDFGTGYSSLAYLQQLPFDRLKIDKRFVRDIDKDASNAAIIRAIIALGHSLGKKVLAEGVETEAELACLREQECDEIQGFYLYVPVPADAIPPLLSGAERVSPCCLGNAVATVAD